MSHIQQIDVNVITGAIQQRDVDGIVVNLFEGQQEPGGATGAVDAALGGPIQELIAAGDFAGKAGQTAVLYPRGAVPARRVILVGLGSRDDFDDAPAEAVRRAAAHAAQKARDLQIARFASILHGAGSGGLSVEEAAQAVTEGSLLGLYEYRGQKTDEPEKTPPQVLELIVFDEEARADDVPSARRGVDAARAIVSGVALARDLVNLPPNICTPTYLAQAAEEVAGDVGLQIEVLDRAQMEALHMGALLAVAQGSDAPPKFIILEHNADRAAEWPTIVLVGKGVTFDTGGYSLKSGEGMQTMKTDMAGAAAVIGALRAIGELDVPLHVVGLVPASDNMISGRAYRPQEVFTASNGVTIEIVSTDAEGRMLLADALVYARRYEPAAVVDIATLTGACYVALGGAAAGLFSTDEGVRDALLAAGDATAEKLWPMPLFPGYKKSLESATADVKNSGGRGSGVGSSATFLKQFVDYPAWAHVDMAGLAFNSGDTPTAYRDTAYAPKKSATGFGVRLFAEFVRRWAVSSNL